jgi:hypothetical protein
MRKHDDFATAFWRKMSESLPPAVREDYLEELKSAEGFDLALDRAAQAWQSLAVLLHYSARRSVH